MRNLIVLTLTILLLFPVIYSAISVGAVTYRAEVTVNDVSWYGNIDPEPGDRNLNLQVTLMLISSEPITRIRATLELPEGFTGPLGTKLSNATYTGTVNPNSQFTLKFKVNVDDRLALGVYNATLKLNYYIVHGKWFIEGEEITTIVPIKLLGRAKIEATMEPLKLKPTTINEVRLTIKNEGSGIAKDLTLSMILQNIIMVEGKNTYHIGELKPGESRLITFKVYVPQNLQGKTINIPLVFSYTSPYDVERVEQQNLHVLVVSPPRRDFELQANTTQVIEEYDNSLTLTLRYTGLVEIYNVSLVLNINNGILLSKLSNTVIPILKPNDTIPIPITVYVLPNAKSLTINVNIEYYDELGVQYSTTTSITLKVVKRVEPEGTLLVYAIPYELVEGEINSIQLTIINKRAETIYDIILSISSTQSFTILGNRTFYIKQLNPGEEKIVNIKVNVPYGVLGATGYFTLNVVFKSSLGELESKVYYVGFVVKQRKLIGGLSIQAVTTNVTAGLINSFHIRLGNMGDTNLRNIRITAQTVQTQCIIVGDNEVYIDSLKPGEKKEIIFLLYTPINTAGTTGKLSLNIQYDTEYSTFTDTITIGFYVNKIVEYGRISIEPSTLYLTANSLNNINITISNTGETISNIKVVLSSTSQDLQIFGKRMYSFDKLDQSEEKVLSITLYPRSNTINTVVYLSIQVSYEDSRGESYTETHYVGFYVQNITYREPRIIVEIPSTTLYPKRENKVNLIIRNVGLGDAYNVRVDVQTPSSITIVKPSSHIEIDSIKAGNSVTEEMLLYVTGAQSKSASKITVTVKYSDLSGIERAVSIQKGLIVEPYTAISPITISVDTPDLYGGILNNITLIVENNGEADLSDVQIIITTPQQISLMGMDNRFYIGNLKAGSRVNLRLTLYAAQQAIGQASKLTVTISYTDPYGDYHTENRIIGLSIRGRIDLKLTGITLTPLPVAPGSTLTISGLIINTGTTTAKSVTLSIVRKPPFEPVAVLGGTVIGDIPSGVQLPFTLTCNVAQDAREGKYTVQIVIEYIDDRGMPVKKTEQIPVVVSAHSPMGGTKVTAPGPIEQPLLYGGSLFYLGLGVLIGLAIMVPVVLKVRKRVSE